MFLRNFWTPLGILEILKGSLGFLEFPLGSLRFLRDSWVP